MMKCYFLSVTPRPACTQTLLHLKNLKGEEFTLDVNPDDTIDEVKPQVLEKEGTRRMKPA